MTTRNRRHQAARMAGLAASLALALTGCAAPDSPPGSTQTSQAPSASARPTAERRYDDGTYTADGWYGSQPSRIGVTLTLADSRITAVQITTPATEPTSLDYQRRFAEAAPDAVIGKHIDDADVSHLPAPAEPPKASTRPCARSARTRPADEPQARLATARRAVAASAAWLCTTGASRWCGSGPGWS